MGASRPLRFTTTGYYTFDLIAGGTAAVGVLPEIALVVDGVNRATFFETTTNLTHYQFTLLITAGTHTIGLAFLNDYYAPPAGPECRLRPPDHHTPGGAPNHCFGNRPSAPGHHAPVADLPGKAYEVQTASDLDLSAWQTLTNFVCSDTMASWRDTGSPRRPAAKCRRSPALLSRAAGRPVTPGGADTIHPERVSPKRGQPIAWFASLFLGADDRGHPISFSPFTRGP